jgi:hypothetical protein
MDHEALVRTLFAANGITPPEEELAMFVAMYPILRAKADRLYELDLGDRP